MKFFLVDQSSEHKKAKAENKNVVARKSNSEYKDVMLNNNCSRHLMNRTQSKNHNHIQSSFFVKLKKGCFISPLSGQPFY